MVQITYIEPGGTAISVNVAEGWSLMQGAASNGVDGILAECGGSCAFATGHCHVEEARLSELPEPTDAELAMLENVAAERRPNQPVVMPDQGERSAGGPGAHAAGHPGLAALPRCHRPLGQAADSGFGPTGLAAAHR